MKQRHGYSNANFTEIIHPKQETHDLVDVVSKTYHAGTVSKYGKLIVYGVGAERGTWGEFANLHLQGLTIWDARSSLTWFTDIYSVALRNQGKTAKKRNFHLTQQQEINPLIETFGIKDYYEMAWEDVILFDNQHGLKEEWQERGEIYDWQTRTLKVEIPLSDCKTEIQKAIVENIIMENKNILNMNGVQNQEEFIAHSFNEGMRGLALGTTDIQALIQQQPVLKVA